MTDLHRSWICHTFTVSNNTAQIYSILIVLGYCFLSIPGVIAVWYIKKQTKKTTETHTHTWLTGA